MLGYFFGMITAFTAVVALAIGLFNITATVNGPRHYPRPVIARAVTAGETAQRHSPAAKEASPAKDVSPIVATAKADTKKSKHYKPKVLRPSAQQLRLWERAGLWPKSGYRTERSLLPLIRRTGNSVLPAAVDVEELGAVTASQPMKAEQAATLKRLAEAAYELEAFQRTSRAEADLRIAMLTAKLKLLDGPPHTL